MLLFTFSLDVNFPAILLLSSEQACALDRAVVRMVNLAQAIPGGHLMPLVARPAQAGGLREA